MSSLLTPSQSSEWMFVYLQITLNLFLSEPSLSQVNCLIPFISYSCCNILVLMSCNCQLFYLTLYISIKLWILNKFIMFVQLYKFCFVCQVSLTSEWLKQPNTFMLGKQPLSAPSGLDWHVLMLARCSRLMHRAGLCLSRRVTAAHDSLYGDAWNSHGISVEDEAVTQKSMHGLALPDHKPKLWASNLWNKERWGWVYHDCPYPTSLTGVISTSLVWMLTLTPSHPWSLYLEIFTLDLMWTLWKMSDGQHIASCSSLPRGVSLVCHWAGGRQSTLWGAFSFSLLSEFVPLGQWWHTQPIELTWPYKEECLLQGWWEKVSFGGGLMSVLSTGSSWGKRGCHQQPGIPLHMVPFPTGPSLSLSLVGISFSQNKVICFQQNGISLSVIALLLCLSLRSGLHLHFLEGFQQSFT